MTDYAEAVRAYLADCRDVAAQLEAAGSALDPKYHPTEAGCLKLVSCRTPQDVAALKMAYRAAAGGAQ